MRAALRAAARTCLAVFLAILCCPVVAHADAAAVDGNRLSYLDGSDPYYVGRGFARLTTPQWVGEPGVEAVVVLAIDDMRDTAPYEAYLRPILDRLKQIDGRAAVSIMACQVDPKDPQVATWLKEGVSLETHTFDHPCPLLAGFDFDKAKGTYDRCVDLLGQVPGSKPVAFRTPCCDSQNTPSPRLYAEIFNKVTPGKAFLTIDTSVFNIMTPKDADLPRELVIDPDGRERFRKYVPFQSFANTIEDYPYPYVIGRLCWQFPCATPSDWQAQNLHKPNNPRTVEDWKALVDVTVLKQGVLNLVFHPHGWIGAQQVVEMIDHTVKKHGRKVKFLNFREAQERVDKHLLAGHPLRAPNGQDNGVRVLDVNADGFMDVVVGNERAKLTRVWSPKEGKWYETELPAPIITAEGDGGARFGVARADGAASLIVRNDAIAGGWSFVGGRWEKDESLFAGLPDDVYTARAGLDRGVRLRDVDHDGRCELIVSNERQQAVFGRSEGGKGWAKLPFVLPPDAVLVDASGADRGLRFVDVDEDGDDDVLFSNQDRYSLHLFTGMTDGWSQEVRAGRRGEGDAADEIPMVVNGRTNNGAWFHSRTMWVQNETTAGLPNLVDRRSFDKLLEGTFPGPLSPQAALKTFKLRSGYHIELMAAEPLVMDPVAFQWGPDGKLWVAEMGDYPRGVDGNGKPGGVIRYLQDITDDGVYDKSTVFLEDVPFPTGVTPWRNGVIVTAAPDIFYAEDTDGDGRADKREVLFTGFGEGNQQHRVNGLVYGLDNWLYGANGDSGGGIKSLKTGKVVDISGRDFRINPDTGEIDPTSGQAQFGRTRDDWGNWFGCNNSEPCWQYVLDDRYVRRNPHVAPPSLRHVVPEVPGPAPVFPASRTIERFNEPHSANRLTSAAGLMFYRDELFGSGMKGNSFVSEPVHNLVHREHVFQDGVRFRSRRIEDETNSEFLASTDAWFRPAQLRTGPDGAVWVADMYRLVIEHPEWIPPDWQAKIGDLRAGHDKGRLYRVVKSDRTPRPIPRLDKLDSAGLVAALDSPGGWQRDMAQQLLVQRKDKSVVPHLEKLATGADRAVTRLHALCTLDGMDAVTPAVLIAALADAQPGVRQNAVRICEARFADAPQLGEAVAKLAADPDPLVRLQVACSLGEWDDPKAGQVLATIALRDTGDRYVSAAVLSSVTGKNLGAVIAGVTQGGKSAPPAELMANLLRVAAATGSDPVLRDAIEKVAGSDGKDPARPFAAVAGLLDALEQAGSSLAALRDRNAELAASVAMLTPVFDAAREAAIDEAAAPERRAAAAALLGRAAEDQAGDADLLAGMLTPQTPENVQSAAIASLSRIADPAAANALLDAWKGMTPALRSQALDAMLRRDERLPLLLDAMEAGTITAVDFDAARRRQLVEHADEAVRSRAAKLFGGSINPDRQKVIDQYAEALQLEGDTARGREFFAAVCAACHKVGDVGTAVGPDLLALSDRSPEYYLVHILDPNRAVEAKFVNYVAQTKRGETFAGVLAGETGSSVTLAGPTGQPQTILRGDLKRLQATALSAMPEGLEAGRTPREFADLLAFLIGSGSPPQPKVFPGNKPALITPEPDGSLRLLAGSAEVYGSSLVFEPRYANLGYWSSADDHAAWQVEVPKPGAYEVVLEWACADGSAGNTFLLRAGKSSLTGKVAGTGDWDTYRTEKAGRIELPAGRQRVVFRSAGPISNALIDLKSIQLVPVKE